MVQIDLSLPYKRALAEAHRVNESPLDLAEKLWRLQKLQPHRLDDVLKNSPLKRRRMYYLIEAWSRVSGLDVPKARLAKIGWTKLVAWARHCPAGQEAWGLDLAEQKSTTAANLPSLLKGRKTPKKTRCMTLYFSLKDYEVFEKAMIDNGAIKVGKGFAAKEKALLQIISKVQVAG